MEERSGLGESEIPQAVQFRRQLEDFVRTAREGGVDLAPYKDDKLRYFNLLSDDTKRETTNAIESYVAALKTISPEKRAKLNTKALIAHYLLDMQIPLREEILPLIEDGWCFEIYSIGGRRLSSNLLIYGMVKLPAENAFARTWFENFERDNQVTESFLEIQRMMAAGEITGAMSHLVKIHEVRDSSNRLQKGAMMVPKVLVPLFDKNGTLRSFIHTFKIDGLIDG